MSRSERPVGRYRIEDIDKPDGPWWRVSGPGVPQPVELRIQLVNGRSEVTGLVLGADEPRPIGTADLRKIKLGEIVGRIFEDWDVRGVADWAQPWAPGPAALLADRGAPNASPPATVPVGRGPDDASLREFAQTYLTEMARRPRRAMTEAAEVHQISRATANRWADLCRQRGYLPPKESR